MKAVLHRPVAEQYPSNTAHVSCLASNRISGMAATEKEKPTPQGRQKPARPDRKRGHRRRS